MKLHAPQGGRTTPAPAGFIQYVSPATATHSSRVYLKCTKSMTSASGLVVFCDKKVRKDTLSKDPEIMKKQLAHKCFAETLDAFVHSAPDPPKLPKAAIQKSIFQFAGKANLSMDLTASSSMRSVVLTSIRVGQENPTIKPDTLYPITSRRVMTLRFIDAGRQLYNVHLQQYKEQRYIALAIDAGKLGRTNYLDILITNAFLDAPPLIQKAIRHFAGDFPSYHNEISTTITELEADGFVVGGIVSDNLRVQVKAISQVQVEKKNKFLHIPCGCHCLSLAIKDLCDDNRAISRAVSVLHDFSILLNTKPVLALLKCSCPSRCLTRWTNIYDIAAWIVSHLDALIAFFQNPTVYGLKSLRSHSVLELCKETMLGAAPLLVLLLQIFKVLSLKLESNRTSAGCIYGYEMSALATFQQLCIERPCISGYRDDVYNAVMRRLCLSTSGMLQKVLFTLLPAGREIEIALRSDPITVTKETIFSRYFPIEPNHEAIELLDKATALLNGDFERSLPLLTEHIAASVKAPPIPPPQSQEELEESLEVSRISATEILRPFHHQHGAIDPDDESSSSDDIDEQTDAELSRVYYNFSDAINDSQFDFDDLGNLLGEQAVRLNLDARKVTIAFSNWVRHPTGFTQNQLHNIQVDDPMATWSFFSLLPEYADLADLARRFLAIPASEAGVEREFWKQRKILTDERVRTGDALAFSRLAFMTLPLPDIK